MYENRQRLGLGYPENFVCVLIFFSFWSPQGPKESLKKFEQNLRIFPLTSLSLKPFPDHRHKNRRLKKLPLKISYLCSWGEQRAPIGRVRLIGYLSTFFFSSLLTAANTLVRYRQKSRENQFSKCKTRKREDGQFYSIFNKIIFRLRYRVFIKYCVFFHEFSKVCYLSRATTRLLLVLQKK